MSIISQKVYHFKDSDGNNVSVNGKKIKVIYEGKESKCSLEDLFIKFSFTENNITGWSILENARLEGKDVEIEGIKFSFRDIEDNETGGDLQLVSIKNPLFQLNDKEVPVDFYRNCLDLIKSIDIEILEEIDEEVETIKEKESEEPRKITKFEIDSDILIKNGYEIIESDNYRLLIKNGAIPVLAKITSEDHYEEYEFVEKQGDKEYVFKDFDNKKINFIID